MVTENRTRRRDNSRVCCRMGKNSILLMLLKTTLKQYGGLSKAVNTGKVLQAHTPSEQWLPRREEMNWEGKAIRYLSCAFI